MNLFLFRSGVYTEPNCGSNILGYHAITVVGYGTLNGLDYWVCYVNDYIGNIYF